MAERLIAVPARDARPAKEWDDPLVRSLPMMALTGVILAGCGSGTGSPNLPKPHGPTPITVFCILAENGTITNRCFQFDRQTNRTIRVERPQPRSTDPSLGCTWSQGAMNAARAAELYDCR